MAISPPVITGFDQDDVSTISAHQSVYLDLDRSALVTNLDGSTFTGSLSANVAGGSSFGRTELDSIGSGGRITTTGNWDNPGILMIDVAVDGVKVGSYGTMGETNFNMWLTNATYEQVSLLVQHLRFTASSDDPFSPVPIGARTVTVELQPYGGVKATADTTVNVVARPEFTQPSASLPNQSADLGDSANTGTLVSTLVGSDFSDGDGDALAGVLVVGNAAAAADGVWQYSTDSGANWHAVGTVGYSTGLLLEASDLVRFVPAADFSGTPGALTVFPVDDSDPTVVFTDGAQRSIVNGQFIYNMSYAIGSSPLAWSVTVEPSLVTTLPTLAADGGAENFVENQAPAALFGNVIASTEDNGQTFTGATLVVDHLADGAAEMLNVGGSVIALIGGANGPLNGGGLYTVSLTGDTATVTLTGMALDNAGMAALIEGITYQNTSDVPTPGQREIALTDVTDSGNSDNTATLTGISATVTVEAVNDAPTFSPPTGGKVNISFGGMNDLATAVAMQADGKIVAAGYHDNIFSVARLNADGSLDTSFGNGGKLVLDGVSSSAQAYDVTILQDGKILLSGSDYANQGMLVVRLNADGTLDQTFGDGGKTVAGTSSSQEYGYKMLVQPDGKILVVGETYQNYSSKPITVARLNADGTPDTSFGTDGVEQVTYFGPQLGASSIALDAAGNILVAGVWDTWPSSDIAVVRLQADGTFDTSFAADSGVARIDLAGGYDTPEALLVLPDGKIVVSGYYSIPGGGQDWGVARLNADGTTDTAFGQNGKVTVSVGDSYDYLYNMVLQSDGKIVLVGSGGQNSNSDVALVRLNADGSLDESFGDGGTVLVSSEKLENGRDVAILPDGKMVVVGYGSPDFFNEYVVLRLNADGSLDNTFNSRPGSNTLDGIASYTEGQPAVVLDADVGVFDAELAARGDYAGASITLARQGGADTQDVFGGSGDLAFGTGNNSVTVSGTTIGTYVQAAGSLTIEFNANATQALVDKALSSVAYSNSSNTPPSSVTIQWTFDDGNSADAQGSGPAGQAIGTSTVNITDVNVAPTLTSIDTVADQAEDTTVTLGFADLLALGNAVDADGSVTSFTVTAVDMGTLKLGTDAASAQPWWPGINATIDASTKAFWTPPANVPGIQAAFKVVAVDNEGKPSTSAVQVNVDLEAQPDRPTLGQAADLLAIDEDVPSADVEDYANPDYLNMGDSIEDLLDASGYGDADDDQFLGVAIAGDASDPLTEGRWQYYSDTDAQGRELWLDIGTVSADQALLLHANSFLRFVPVDDFHGTPGGLTVHVVDISGTRTFTTWDGTAEDRHTVDVAASNATDISAAGVTWNVDVSSVADAPVFTGLGTDDDRAVDLPSGWLRLDTGAAATVTDADAALITAGSLRVEFASGGNLTDQLALDSLDGRVAVAGTTVLVDNVLIGTITEPNNVNALVMDLTNASMEQISLLLQRVSFNLDNETAGTRVIEITLNDGEEESTSQVTLDAKPLPKVEVALSAQSFTAGETLTATFTLSEASNDFTADDITVEGGTLSGFARDAVNPLNYTATITPTQGENDVEVSVSVAAGRFENANGAQNPASGNATATGDTQAPEFAAMVPTGAAVTSADTLTFRATFDEDMVNIDAADFRVTGTSGASVTNVSKIDEQTYDITVGGGNLADFNGEVGLALASGTDITDAAGNALSDLEPGSSSGYTLDNTAPALISVVRGDVTQPAAGQSLSIQVSLAETGSGINAATVDLADIAVTGPGGTVLSVTGASYDSATGVATYTVAPPLGGWDLGVHAGLYTVALNPNQVLDQAGLALAADPQAHTFEVIANATPVITSNGGSATVALNHAEGVLAVTTITATDNDGDALTYHIADGADKALFTIDAASGELAFSNQYWSNAPADAGSDGVYEVIVEARDTKGGVATQSISVSVLSDIDSDGIPDVDDNDADGDGLTDDAESSVPDLTGGGYGDGNGDGTDDGMQLNVASVPTLGNGTPDQLWATLAVAEGLQLTNVTNEAAPGDLPRNVKMPVGQFGFTIKGVEVGGSTQVDFYVDASQRVNSFYKFNADTGRWTNIGTASAVPGSDKVKVSFELKDGGVYDADGEANGVIVDPGGLAVVAPLITSNGGDITAAVNVAENGTAVSTVLATLPPGASSLTYAITGGADAARFTIDPDTGILAFVSAPDFETPMDMGGTLGDNVYEVNVTATDGQGEFDTQALSVTVTDVNEAPTVSVAITAQAVEGATDVNVDLLQNVIDQDAGSTLQVRADSMRFVVDGSETANGGTALPTGLTLQDNILVIGSSTEFDFLAEGAEHTIVATYLVEDEHEASVEQTTTITITGTNDAPVIAQMPDAPQWVTVGRQAALPDFIVSDVDGDELTLTLNTINGKLGKLTDADTDATGIQLIGTAEEINAALASATFTATRAGGATLEFSLSDGHVAAPIVASYLLQASDPLEPPVPPKPPVIPPVDQWEDLPDDDGDGVPESVENLVPGMTGGVAGDGNGDGTADIDQTDVSSLPWAQTPDGTTRFVTLTNGSGLAQIGVKPLEVSPGQVPSDLNLPLGLLAFQVDKVPDSGRVDFTVYLDSDIAVNGYWKQIDGEWVNIARSITTEGGKTKISFTIEDGGRFDADGIKNGSIVDPGAPGWRNVVNPAEDADGDQFPDALESEHGLQAGVKDNDVFASSKLFVMQLYRDFLYREAEPEGLGYWQARLDSGELTHADVAHAFLFASEFQDNAGAIARLYLGTYDRIPDNEGMHYWVDAVQDGQSLTQVAEQFAASDEFAEHYGSLDNEGFVSELYLNVQGRAADAGGSAWWVSQLEAGMSRGEVLVRFTQSDEYVEQSREEVSVTLDYVGLLDRTPEQAGFDYWVHEIEAGHSQLEVIGKFIGTEEYHDRFLPADAETTQIDVVGQGSGGEPDAIA